MNILVDRQIKDKEIKLLARLLIIFLYFIFFNLHIRAIIQKKYFSLLINIDNASCKKGGEGI